ncbi:VOC family protein [Leucobacter allii]|uniref:VOC family protein n=1 Tax=Leucobacter allii TaxID=2932247 RepID=UPI001FCFE958|nr:VOC family protein [Leucobacter allii]UOR01443.1 VOC family protein [Leucobacter allii]
MTAAHRFPDFLDHVVIAGPSLPEVVARFTELTGVQAQPGGQHDIGTANALLRLTVPGEPDTRYLELIGLGPDRSAPAERDVFGVNTRDGIGVAAFCIRPGDLDAHAERLRTAGIEPHGIGDQSRRTPDGELLAWRLISPPSGVATSLEPFSIDWLASRHPASATAPAVELLGLSGRHPEPERLRARLAAAGVGLDVARGDEPALVLRLGTPRGEVEFSAL